MARKNTLHIAIQNCAHLIESKRSYGRCRGTAYAGQALHSFKILREMARMLIHDNLRSIM